MKLGKHAEHLHINFTSYILVYFIHAMYFSLQPRAKLFRYLRLKSHCFTL